MELKVNNICCIGAGYVGGPSMAVIADKCPDLNVVVVDINEDRIKAWNDLDYSKLPVFEPGLDLIIKRCRGRNLFFSSEVEKEISYADMIFLSVNTPIKTKGIGAGQASDLKWIESSSRQVAKYAKGTTIVVEKSTLPVRTAETIKEILENSYEKENISPNKNKIFYILSNPEFLAEGTAINDLEKPDRVLIGGENEFAIAALENIYSAWIPRNKIIKTNLWSSELSKLTANAFLAERISSINSISALCEETGANINEVAKAIGTDTRIGSKFLNPGPGFGGSCFKKDILNLVYICNYYGLTEVANYWEQIIKINDWQQKRISTIIVKKLFGTISEKKISIMGFSFKANTNDTRESPSIRICKDLINEGANLSIYDPKVTYGQIKKELNTPNLDKGETRDVSTWIFSNSIEDACKDADAIIITTEWEEFKKINWEKIHKITRKPTWIFDTRNIIDEKLVKNFGFNIWKLGLGDI